MAQRTAKPYRTERGNEPYTEYLDKLRDERAEARILDGVKRVEEGKYGKVTTLTKGEGVKEIVIDEGSGHRVYFAEEGKTIILLLSAGPKKSWKRDWKRAVSLWREYKARKGTK